MFVQLLLCMPFTAFQNAAMHGFTHDELSNVIAFTRVWHFAEL